MDVEWKVDKDRRTDTHRHLSHLIGLYPGYAIASYRGPNSVDDSTLASNTGLNLTRDALFTATKTSLVARGRGIGPDADAGWEKVWRAAAWAQLGDAERYYDELAVSLTFPSSYFPLIRLSFRSRRTWQTICSVSTTLEILRHFSRLMQIWGILLHSLCV